MLHAAENRDALYVNGEERCFEEIRAAAYRDHERSQPCRSFSGDMNLSNK
jgi:hypothetical protein